MCLFPTFSKESPEAFKWEVLEPFAPSFVWSNELLRRTATSVGEMLQGFTALSLQERTEI